MAYVVFKSHPVERAGRFGRPPALAPNPGRGPAARDPDWSRLLPWWVFTIQPDGLYLAVRASPNRIDLVNEDLGWGVQETLKW